MYQCGSTAGCAKLGILSTCMHDALLLRAGLPSALAVACNSLSAVIQDHACPAQQAPSRTLDSAQQQQVLVVAMHDSELLVRFWFEWVCTADIRSSALSNYTAGLNTLPAVSQLAMVLLRTPAAPDTLTKQQQQEQQQRKQ